MSNDILNIKAYVYSFLHKVCKFFSITIFFDNGYGIKAFNKPLFKQINCTDETIIFIEPKELYLGFDALKDDYTLTNINITKSPHFSLVETLKNNPKDVEKCDYIIRSKKGKLDGRYEQVINSKTIDMHINKFKNDKHKIINGRYNPVLVYKLCDRYYIMDGKHRAAMCALFKVPVKCRLIDTGTIINDPYTGMILNKFNNDKNKYKYKKNLEFLLMLN